MGVKFKNNATTTLVGSLANSTAATSMQVTNGGLFPYLVAGDWFPLTVVQAGTGLFEIMRCTGHVSTNPNTLTVDRAEEGTGVLTFANGDKVDLRMTAGALTAALDELETEFNSDLATLQHDLEADIAAKPSGAVISRLYTAASSTWTKPAKVNGLEVLKGLEVLVVAGGGGGAGVPATALNQHYAGGGGGAGGSCYKAFSASEIAGLPATVSVKAGAGGAGGTNSTGANGGDSSFHTNVVAQNGIGGLRSAVATTVGGPLEGAGGNGGGSSGGTVNYWGQAGGHGVANVERNTYSRSGAGGTSPYGSAPVGHLSQHLAGEAALGYGAGGSGACNSHVQPLAMAGGKGAPGFVMVIERY